MRLSTALENIKGVGPKTAEQLKLSGLETVRDLIFFLPRKYEDFSELTEIDSIKPGKRTVKARVESVSVRRVRRGMTITTAVLIDGSGKLNAVWFNQPYRATQFKQTGLEYFFSGDFEFSYNKYQLTNPSAELVKEMPVQTDRILPIYRSVKGLKSQVVRKILHELRPLITMLTDTSPKHIIEGEKLLSLSDALLAMHFPTSMAEVTKAKERIAFDELFSLLLAVEYGKQENSELQTSSIPFNSAKVKEFVEKLPFTLTNDQRVAAWEAIQDMEKTTPMNRMLQGDVGSGKTVVAGLAAYSAAVHGFQSAIMAPTEILAVQHAETLTKLLAPFSVTVGLLTGSVKQQDKKRLYESIENGIVDIVVGTHALIQDSVRFKHLAFVAIDEQHRFGVAQRQALLTKATDMPHLLAMTATPIPRSLQLTVFGDMDISIIKEKPANRKEIQSKIISPVSSERVYELIDAEIEKGRQAYVICSLIDDSAISDKKSVEVEYKKLKNSVFGHRSIGMLHGKMKPQEKDHIMNEFKQGVYDILVSTTVVEVGVDVPNASVIMIENADQFGLAQLHQLRGRVGRGEHQSYCYLMMSDTKKPSERLREVERSNDGFYLAEVDLKLRGPGEIYGRAQHGVLDLQVASLADTALVKRAKNAAKAFLDSKESIDMYAELKASINRYQRLTTLN